MKALILNNTCGYHFGCDEVMQNLHKLCHKHKIEIMNSVKHTMFDRHQMKACDAVIINGEGTMHDNAGRAHGLLEAARIAKKEGKKTFLINSVWQNNDRIKSGLQYIDKIFVRESLSKEAIEKDGFKATVVPDLSLYISEELPTPKKDLELVVTDCVLKEGTCTLQILADRKSVPMYYMSYNKEPRLDLDTLLRAKAVLTGRFHAVTMCIKHDIHFSYFPSNTHKIEGMLKDMGGNREGYLKDTQILINNMMEAINETLI